MEIRKASRTRTKLRIGFSGPSGSGKTYSALLLASGLTNWNKIVLIDTEQGSGELYSHLGPYDVIEMTKPFSPDRYIEAIKLAESGSYDVIVIDSVSHEWDGEGGCLEMQEKYGGRYQDWAKVTPRHRKFLNAILQSDCHVLTTTRRKQDYSMVQENNRTKVQKMGLKEIQREGFEYELTINFEIAMNHHATASKDRTGLFAHSEPFLISADTGEVIMDWNNGGKVAKKAKPKVKKPTTKQLGHMFGELKKAGMSPDELKALMHHKLDKVSTKDLNLAEFEMILTMIKNQAQVANASV